MSNLFSRLNDVISQSQHDAAEIGSPSVARCPTSLFHRPPDVSTIPDDDPKICSPSVARRPTSLFRRPPDVSTIPDDDPNLLILPKVPTNSDGWVKRRSRDEVEDFQDHISIMKQRQRNAALEANRATNISKLKVGVEVWTKDAEISELSKNKGPKGKRRYREKTFGIIKERSNKNSSFWYVEFNNGKSVFCSESILVFHNDVPQVVHLGTKKNNQLCLTTNKDTMSEPKEPSLEVQDKIKTKILLEKIYKLPGHDEITYESLASIHISKYPWINPWKLRFHVFKMRKHLMKEASSDSWITNLTNNPANDDRKLSEKFISQNIKKHRLCNKDRYPYTKYKCLLDIDCNKSTHGKDGENGK